MGLELPTLGLKGQCSSQAPHIEANRRLAPNENALRECIMAETTINKISQDLANQEYRNLIEAKKQEIEAFQLKMLVNQPSSSKN